MRHRGLVRPFWGCRGGRWCGRMEQRCRPGLGEALVSQGHPLAAAAVLKLNLNIYERYGAPMLRTRDESRATTSTTGDE